MIIVCKKTQGNFPPLVIPRQIGLTISNNNFVASSEWYTISSELSGYSLTKEKEYIVYGVLFFDNLVRYLVVDDHSIPCFFPAPLFTVQHSLVPYDWQACEYSLASGKLLVLGYPLITESYSELVELIDCANGAISRFQMYKDQIIMIEE